MGLIGFSGCPVQPDQGSVYCLFILVICRSYTSYLYTISRRKVALMPDLSRPLRHLASPLQLQLR